MSSQTLNSNCTTHNPIALTGSSKKDDLTILFFKLNSDQENIPRTPEVSIHSPISYDIGFISASSLPLRIGQLTKNGDGVETEM